MFEIPNTGSGVNDNQSELDAGDIAILVAGLEQTGVEDGCAVTAHADPLTVAVAAGNVALRGTSVAVAAGNVVLDAADPTNPRFDLIVVDGAGAKSKITGTPAAEDAIPGPAYPAIPATGGSLDRIVLAAVWVPAADSAIQQGQIRDKRVPVVLAAGGGAGRSVRVVRTTDQAINTGAATPISWSSASFESAADMWDAANPTRIYAREAGRYAFKMMGRWASNSNGYRYVYVYKNGVANGPFKETNHALSGTRNTYFDVADTIELDADDYLEVYVFHNSTTSPLSIIGTGETTYACLEKVS